MSAQKVPYFHAIQDGYLYRVYVTSTDLLCVRLGKGQMPVTSRVNVGIGVAVGAAFSVIGVAAAYSFGFGVGRSTGGVLGTGAATIGLTILGGIIALAIRKIKEANQNKSVINEMSRFERDVEEEAAALAKRGDAGIRGYIQERKRGFVLDPDKFEEARIDHLGKWKRMFFGTPVPALIVQHRSKGTCTLMFRKKLDIVTALYELPQLLGKSLEIDESMDDYDNALRKYEKSRDA